MPRGCRDEHVPRRWTRERGREGVRTTTDVTTVLWASAAAAARSAALRATLEALTAWLRAQPQAADKLEMLGFQISQMFGYGDASAMDDEARARLEATPPRLALLSLRCLGASLAASAEGVEARAEAAQ